MTHIDLPKPDKRYKPGKIVKDKKGNYRGHPDTVDTNTVWYPDSATIEMKLNPPIVVSEELGKFTRKGLDDEQENTK